MCRSSVAHSHARPQQLMGHVLLQVHKFSKFIHGTSVLLPDMVQAVPYWIDDESIRKSIIQSSKEG